MQARVWRFSALALLAVALGGCALGAPPAVAPIKITIGTPSTNANGAVMYVAQQAGIFAKYGVETTLTSVAPGQTQLAALQSGDIQFTTGGTLTLAGRAAGVDVAVYSLLMDKMLFSFVAAPNIHSAADLRGKVVAAGPAAGGVLDFCARVGLQHLGLTVDDVQFSTLNWDSGTGVQMLSTDRVGAGCLEAAVMATPQARPLNVLYDLSQGTELFPWLGYLGSRSYVSAHRNDAKQFLKGQADGIQYFKKNPDQAKKMLGTYLNIDDPVVLQQQYDVTAKYLLDNPTPVADAQKLPLEMVALIDPRVNTVKLEDTTDDSLWKELVSEGFLQQIGVK